MVGNLFGDESGPDRDQTNSPPSRSSSSPPQLLSISCGFLTTNHVENSYFLENLFEFNAVYLFVLLRFLSSLLELSLVVPGTRLSCWESEDEKEVLSAIIVFLGVRGMLLMLFD
jgi:hypothetical protein